MTFKELQRALQVPYFSSFDVQKIFAHESARQIATQLQRFKQKGEIKRLKRGLYVLADVELPEFLVSYLLYQPSYVSLESALHAFAMIPEVPAETTAVNPTTTKQFKNHYGRFSYVKLKSALFFGFYLVDAQPVQIQAMGQLGWTGLSLGMYRLAYPEKALLDYIYVRYVDNLNDLRLSGVEELNLARLNRYLSFYPKRVTRVWQQFAETAGFEWKL